MTWGQPYGQYPKSYILEFGVDPLLYLSIRQWTQTGVEAGVNTTVATPVSVRHLPLARCRPD